MSFKQCPGCEAMVSSSKAYCPDCGTPMDEEQKRNNSSEFDSLMKTQNLNSTSQLKLLEEINLNTFFNLSYKSETEPPKPIENKETKPVEVKSEPVQQIPPNPIEKEAPKPPPQSNRTEGQTRPPVRFTNSSENLTKTIYLMPQAEAKPTSNQPPSVVAEPKKKQALSPSVPVNNNKPVENRVVENKSAPVSNTPVGTPPKSKKTLYIVGGILLLFFALALVSVIVGGFLYWNYWK